MSKDSRKVSVCNEKKGDEEFWNVFEEGRDYASANVSLPLSSSIPGNKVNLSIVKALEILSIHSYSPTTNLYILNFYSSHHGKFYLYVNTCNNQ